MDQLPSGMAENLDDNELVKIQAMISSFTAEERRDPQVLIREPNRAKRIAKGSGAKPGQTMMGSKVVEISPEQGVLELVNRFMQMKQMMDMLGGGGGGGLGGLLGKIPGMKNINMANALRKMQKGQMPPGMPDLSALGMGGLGGMGGLLGGMGMDPGAESMTKMKPMSDKERNARKAARKREKEARRKSRR